MLCIILNGSRTEIPNTELTYYAVIALAQVGDGATVTYSYPPHDGVKRLGGTLHAGSDPIPVVEGMVVTAVHTGAA